VHYVSLGCVSVKWLLETMEAWHLAKVLKEFYRSSRVGSKAYIAQHCSNCHSCFLVVAEYGGSGQEGFAVISEGKGGRVGWVSLLVWKILEVFQISYGVVLKAPHFEVSLDGQLWLACLYAPRRYTCVLIEDTLYQSYTNALVGQGLGLVNTSSHSDSFAKLEGSIPQGQYDNGRVTFVKGMNPRPSASSICGVVLLIK